MSREPAAQPTVAPTRTGQERQPVTALAARRRHPMAAASCWSPGPAGHRAGLRGRGPSTANAAAADPAQVAEGRKLFLANCSTCHGLNAEGRNNAPSLIGVGAAAVDFQVGTGRMPLPPAVRRPRRPRCGSATRRSSSSPPTSPRSPRVRPSRTPPPSTGPSGNASRGDLIFRTNCAMCHNFAGKGGALTRGKYAPT